MKFNLDIVESYLKDFKPTIQCRQSSKLHLLNITLKTPQEHEKKSMLYIVDASHITEETAASLEGTYLVITNACTKELRKTLRTTLPSNAYVIFLTEPCSEIDVCEVLLHMMERINTWSEEVLIALTQNKPLADVAQCAQTIFQNPLMNSDSAMCFTMVTGALPADFHDTLWTPAIQTGYCPLEKYYELWHVSSKDPFDTNRAFIVQDDSLCYSYLYRNLICGERYYGSFELIDTERPFTRADISFADYLGYVLTSVFSSHQYLHVTEASSNPLHDMMHGRPVRQEFLEFILNRIHWDIHDEYHVTCFEPVGALRDKPSAQLQCRKRLESAYPEALIFEEDDGSFTAIKRQVDFPLESAACTSEGVSKLFAPPYEIAMGASSTMFDFQYLPNALTQAQFALDYAKRDMQDPETGVAHLVKFDECYFDAFVQSFSDQGFFAILDVAPVKTLIASDKENQTEYIPTLIAFFEHGFNIHNTAEALHVHRNTLTYRLKRIKRLSGIDCEDPTQSTVDPLRVYVSCRAHVARGKQSPNIDM